MQKVVSDRPYVFVPPQARRWWPRLLQTLLPWRLSQAYGLESVTCAGIEKLTDSLRAGRGVLITPNHCRPCDPEVIHEMLRRVRVVPYMMASWHLFLQSPVQSFLLRTTGTFSVYREGTDRAAIATSIDLLARGGRPLVVFPEGVQTRTNDRLNPLLEGVAFIARRAARERARQGAAAGVVVHPVALRYRFDGDVEAAVAPALAEIERRLSWRPQVRLRIEDRLAKLGSALLALKEIEHFGHSRDGTLAERRRALVDGLLAPLEREWIKGPVAAHTVARVKNLRAAVLHEMHHGDLPPGERARRWEQLADMYLAQSVSFYPPDYIGPRATPEHVLETVERLEEDLTDACRRYAPLHVTVTVGDAIEVTPERVRGVGDDPLLGEIDAALRNLLGIAP